MQFLGEVDVLEVVSRDLLRVVEDVVLLAIEVVVRIVLAPADESLVLGWDSHDVLHAMGVSLPQSKLILILFARTLLQVDDRILVGRRRNKSSHTAFNLHPNAGHLDFDSHPVDELRHLDFELVSLLCHCLELLGHGTRALEFLLRYFLGHVERDGFPNNIVIGTAFALHPLNTLLPPNLLDLRLLLAYLLFKAFQLLFESLDDDLVILPSHLKLGLLLEKLSVQILHLFLEVGFLCN